MTYHDAILYIANFSALVATIDLASFVGSTPEVRKGDSALLYVRMLEDDVALWSSMPGVTILAESIYTGDSQTTSDIIYNAVFANAEAAVLYDSVYDRSIQTYIDDGIEHIYTPPAKFGVLA